MRRLLGGALAAAALFAALAPAAPAHAQFVPYFGKNKIKYDDFDWRIYKSPHFEIYYYPEFEQHLPRLASYMESAYQKVSSELKHEISFAIPVILYKTHAEFEQTNLYPTFVPEGVMAFAEPVRDRMVLPIDEPPDKLYGLIVHELTHIFEFDIIPRSLVRRDVPLWVDEGLSDYLRGTWETLDLMMVRDAAIADMVPRMSRTSSLEAFGNPRLTYNMGHAAFEFIEARFGKEGVRQFLYMLRKAVVGGGLDDIYMQAFRLKPDEFDDGFEKWLKERFKPFRDRQRPSDYGINLAPDVEKTPYVGVYAFAPSPSGEMVAAITGNRGEGEADLVLLSTRDGSVIKNLTGGYTGRWESISFNDDFVAGRTIDFSPDGDAVAFFGRTDKRRSLFLVSALSGDILREVQMPVDQAQAPCLLPGGRQVLFAALQDGVSDLFLLDLETEQVQNLTRDAWADSDPRISPDGKTVAYTRRISGHEKIWVFPLADPSKKTQLTFGPFDDKAPAWTPEGKGLIYSSNEEDDTFNLRTLNLETGVIQQWTEVLGGNLAPHVLAAPGRGVSRVAFISYFKGGYGLYAMEPERALKEVEQDVVAVEGDLVDFQPDLVHQVVAENKRGKRSFENFFLEGRPPLNVGVTSAGDFFGGSQVAFSDVLQDKNLVVTIASVRDFRTYDASFLNQSRRFQYGLSAFDNTYFFYPNYYIPQNDFFREGAIATQRLTGASAVGIYPLDKFRRLEFRAGLMRLRQEFENPAVQQAVEEAAAQAGDFGYLYSGTLAPLSVALVQETTRFREFGPLSGSTFLARAAFAPNIGNSLQRYTLDGDFRKYLRLTGSTLLAARARGFKSWGESPETFYFGGNMELRGVNYLSMTGNEGFFANLELRFPIIELMLTPIGVLGPVRGTVYAGVGHSKYKGQRSDFAENGPGVSYINDPVFGEPIDGFHLVDGRASYGFGLQFFFLGYPLHFDWTKFTDLQVTSNDTRFDFWIGYDF
ncbi:MAG: BamA/TamA family outer membrane protein [Vicinamibacteria bacterium]|nr:BamA/TamA family outer membrane protein [Vicinamibacteria bacterium]